MYHSSASLEIRINPICLANSSCIHAKNPIYYRESPFSTVSFSAIPGLVRFEKALNSADSPIQCGFLRRRMLFCMAFTSKNVSKLQQKLHFSKRNEKTINICSKPFIKIYSIDYIISKVISYLFDSHNSDFIPLISHHLLVKEQRKRGL